jgi:ribosomal-protein-alanine N-acetyltransferase
VIASLREARLTDYAAINDLATALVHFPADRRASLDAVLTSAEHDLIVAEVESEVIGYVHLMTYQDLSHGALAADLLGLVVRSDMRRRGIGTALLREIIRLATKRGVGELHVNAEPDNDAALSFYRRHGAHIVRTQLEFDLAGGSGRRD